MILRKSVAKPLLFSQYLVWLWVWFVCLTYWEVWMLLVILMRTRVLTSSASCLWVLTFRKKTPSWNTFQNMILVYFKAMWISWNQQVFYFCSFQRICFPLIDWLINLTQSIIDTVRSVSQTAGVKLNWVTTITSY